MLGTRGRVVHARAVSALTVAGLAAVLGIAVVGPAQAALAAPARQGPIGGPGLGARGVVLNRGPGVPPLPRHLKASAWLVADASTGEVLAAKDPHGRFLPASTLKILTAVTLIPRLRPNAVVRPTSADEAVGGSMVGLVPGFPYKIRTVFTAMLVVSGNDAAEALAQAAGGIRRTLDLMNAEARHLQADDTIAKTPSGLDARGETTSAYDLALIARAGLAMPAFRHYVGTVISHIPYPARGRRGRHARRHRLIKTFEIYTHNELLTTYKGDIGVKNGYTVHAMGTYVGAATRGGRTILVTLLHANPNFWPMARQLLNWGFRADGRVRPVGTLVPPLSSTLVRSHGAAHRGAAGGGPSLASGGGDALTLPLAAAGGGVAFGLLLVAGQRRRSRRRGARRYSGYPGSFLR